MRAHPHQGVTGEQNKATVTWRPSPVNGKGRAGAAQGQAARRRATEGAPRSVGCLDSVTGRVVTRRAKTIGLAMLGQRSRYRCAASPAAARIAGILIWDPSVGIRMSWQRALQTTWSVFPSRQVTATSRVQAVRRARGVRLPVRRMPLPGDAS